MNKTLLKNILSLILGQTDTSLTHHRHHPNICIYICIYIDICKNVRVYCICVYADPYAPISISTPIYISTSSIYIYTAASYCSPPRVIHSKHKHKTCGPGAIPRRRHRLVPILLACWLLLARPNNFNAWFRVWVSDDVWSRVKIPLRWGIELGLGASSEISHLENS